MDDLERDVRERLKELGFDKIRKRQGQYDPLICADNSEKRIWVNLKSKDFETCFHNSNKRESGTINDLFRDVEQSEISGELMEGSSR